MKRTLVLENERPLSWNELYAGKHWAIRQEKARRAHALVRAALDPEDPPFERPVKITMTAYYAHNPIDASNICSKIYEDGLKGWMIVDDSPEFVYSMTTISRIDKARPRLEIEVEAIENGELIGSHVSCRQCGRKFTNIGALLEHINQGECNGSYDEI